MQFQLVEHRNPVNSGYREIRPISTHYNPAAWTVVMTGTEDECRAVARRRMVAEASRPKAVPCRECGAEAMEGSTRCVDCA